MASELVGKEMLYRSREFIRQDSTYYLGHMLEGIYKTNHASDLFGYQNAIAPLVRAKDLLEADFEEVLRHKSGEVFALYQIYQVQMDYQQICYELFHSYMNTARYEEAWALCLHASEYNLQLEYYFNAYTSLTWLVNKVRTSTQQQFYFLKNTIGENIELAQRFLDTALARAEENRPFNENFLPGLYEANIGAVHHYRALLYAYTLNTDSADRYYDLMMAENLYSHNNRGNYLVSKGLFRQAEVEYRNEQLQWDPSSRRNLKEHIYYDALIDIYKGQPDSAIVALTQTIKNNGSTPGFGWYQMGLARAYVYNGNLHAARTAITKAGRFQEIHIGTSLGQQHYDFSLAMIRYGEAKNELNWIKKRYKRYWLNVSLWPRLLNLFWKIYTIEYQIVSALGENEERKEVIYPIFATESVIAWDEFYRLIAELDRKFFIDFFEKKLKEDKRPDVLRYYKIFLAKLHYVQGEEEKAVQYLDEILGTESIDYQYEKLLLARCYELYALISEDRKKYDDAARFANELYNVYPQMAGYSGFPIRFHLNWDGAEDEYLITSFEKANIQLEDTSGPMTQEVNIKVMQEDEHKILEIQVTTSSGEVLSNQRFVASDERALAFSALRALYGMAQLN